MIAGAAVHAETLPLRIITLSPHLAELVCLLDSCERLSGVIEHSDYPEQVKTMPRIGSSAGIDLERVLSIDPDLVIAWQGGSREVDVARLEELGLNVVRIRSEYIEDIPASIRTLGDLLGQSQLAINLINDFQQQLTSIKDKYATLPDRKVFIEISAQPLMGLTDRHSLSSGLKLCGLQNIFNDIEQGAVATNLEAVLSRAPYYVVLRSSLSDDDIDARKNYYRAHGGSGFLFLGLDDDRAFRQTPRILMAIDAICAQAMKAEADR